MSRRRVKWLAGITALILLAMVAVFMLPVPRYALMGWLKGESFFDGKPTSYWRDAIVTSRQPPSRLTNYFWRWSGGSREDAWQPLLHGNPASLPVLHELLRDEDSHVRGWSGNGLANIQRRAMDSGTTVPELAVTVPTLMDILSRVEHGSKIEVDKLHAVITLGEFGPMAKASVPLLREKLKWSNLVAQMVVARSLTKIDPHQTEARQRLIAGLTDPNSGIRLHAVEGLEELLRYHPNEGLRILRQEPALPAALQSTAKLEQTNPTFEGKVKAGIERLLQQVTP
jgi:hypothetical protein